MTGWGRPGYNKGMSSSDTPTVDSVLSADTIRTIGVNHKYAALYGCAQSALETLLFDASYGTATAERIQRQLDRLAATEAAFNKLLEEDGLI